MTYEKAHEHDIDSTPDYSAAKKVAMDIRKAIQSSGDYLGKVWAVIFNTLGLDFYKLPPDEQKILKKILSKAPNIQKQPLQLPAQEKMKTAVVGRSVPATAISLGDDIHFFIFVRIFFIFPIPPF